MKGTGGIKWPRAACMEQWHGTKYNGYKQFKNSYKLGCLKDDDRRWIRQGATTITSVSSTLSHIQHLSVRALNSHE